MGHWNGYRVIWPNFCQWAWIKWPTFRRHLQAPISYFTSTHAWGMAVPLLDSPCHVIDICLHCDWILFVHEANCLWDIHSIKCIKKCHLLFVDHFVHAWTHWGRDNRNAIWQTTFSDAFSWMKMFEYRLKFHWSLFLMVKLTIFQHWFR